MFGFAGKESGWYTFVALTTIFEPQKAGCDGDGGGETLFALRLR